MPFRKAGSAWIAGQLGLRRRARSLRGRLLLFQLHDPFDGEEQHPRDDEKVQRDGQKLSPAEDRALFLRINVGEARLHLGG
jgi:hypothetical protein